MKPKLHAAALALSLTFAFVAAHAQDTASITQHGGSVAAIDQRGNQGANIATIEQEGENTASISQSNVRDATASISQSFSATSNASIDQHDSSAVSAIITQQGPDMKATVVQAGSNQSDVRITQDEILRGGSEASVTVQDSVSTSVLIEQGSGSRVEAIQSNVVNGRIEVAAGIILPSARIYQHDASNVAATVYQAGDVDAQIEQTGDGGTVFVSQNGSALQANVMQDGGIAGPGAGSLVSITQEASLQTADVTQVGRGFTATVTQTMGDGNTATINQHF